MSKIRVNELARQLEVKSKEVLDKLAEFGAPGKLSHSSSIEDDMVDRLRRYYGGDLSAAHEPPPRPTTSEAAEAPAPSPVAAPAPQAEKPAPDAAAPAAPAAAAGTAEKDGEKKDAEKKDKDPKDDDRPRVMPLRPPLLSRGAPLHPPVGVRPLLLRPCCG